MYKASRNATPIYPSPLMNPRLAGLKPCNVKANPLATDLKSTAIASLLCRHGSISIFIEQANPIVFIYSNFLRMPNARLRFLTLFRGLIQDIPVLQWRLRWRMIRASLSFWRPYKWLRLTEWVEGGDRLVAPRGKRT